MRRIVCILFLLSAMLLHAADTEVLGKKAQRAFEAREWASAQALYNLVSDAQPKAPVPYGRAAVASLMRGDTTATTAEIERALSHGVALDSVLAVIERESLALGEGEMYARELHRLDARVPYLRRPVYARLLRYYKFRRNPAQVIKYSLALLRGLPDSAQFLNDLAWGYSMNGESEKALDTWLRTLEVDPDNLEALVCAGNALLLVDREKALTYLRKAYSIRPSEYLRQIIESSQRS